MGRLFISLTVAICLLSSGSALALINCHDYTYYRALKIDPSPPGPEYNAPGGYQHVVDREPLEGMKCDSPKQPSVDNDSKCPPEKKNVYKGSGIQHTTLRQAIEKDYDVNNLDVNAFLAPDALKPGDVIIAGVSHSGYVNASGKIDHFKQLPPRMDRYPREFYSSEIWSVDQLSSLQGPLCTPVNELISYGGLMLNETPETFLNRSTQIDSTIQVWRPKKSGSGAYAVFILTNVSGGSIYVGTEAELATKFTYDFAGGGRPAEDGSGTKVAFEKKSADFATPEEARKFYCQSLTSTPREIPLTHGKKANIFGGDYWVDTAPACP